MLNRPMQFRLQSNYSLIWICVTISDELYLNKTIHDSGSFKRCDAFTCGEFGKCESTGYDRYRCACHPQYTGKLVILILRFYLKCANPKKSRLLFLSAEC